MLSFFQGQNIASVSISFSLMLPRILILSWPVKNGTFPLPYCSYNRIKDWPYPIPHFSHKSQNLEFEILTKVFSAQILSQRAVLRTVRLPQDAHHLQEQTQKTTVWCSIEWVNGTKTDGRKLTKELEEVQTMWRAGPKLQQGQGAERQSLLLCGAKIRADHWKQRATIPHKYRFQWTSDWH